MPLSILSISSVNSRLFFRSQPCPIYGDVHVPSHHYHPSLLLITFPNTISAYIHHTTSYMDLNFSPINFKLLENSKYHVSIFVFPYLMQNIKHWRCTINIFSVICINDVVRRILKMSSRLPHLLVIHSNTDLTSVMKGHCKCN